MNFSWEWVSASDIANDVWMGPTRLEPLALVNHSRARSKDMALGVVSGKNQDALDLVYALSCDASVSKTDRAEADPKRMTRILLAKALITCAMIALSQPVRNTGHEHLANVKDLWMWRTVVTENHVQPSVRIVRRAIMDNRVV